MLAIERPIVAGLQAPFPPFGGSAIENESTWRKTLSGAGLAHQPLFQYSMDPAGGWAAPRLISMVASLLAELATAL